jgi:deoxyribodipyrimidine photo-lyase
VAGCGFDAAPFFRIFNPITQSQKFDPEGVYIKRWVPELAHVPAAFIHTPWSKCSHYAEPVVNHDEARKQALQAFKELK